MKFTFVALLSLFALTSNSYANAKKTTGWFTGYDRKSVSILRKKLIHSIKCRDTGNTGLRVRKGEFKVTYSDNPNKIKFRWAIGSHYGPSEVFAKKNGYKRVSYDQFRRKPSGLLIRCGVWHKK